ncbi:vacuolar protein sorting-associated protein 37D-like [Gouania willdenowi]|uniref:vacuolar protein sorting-associated protein 37D-like n=1 Tax=Gouania willdenowi TaxID=441366 RepID=UPI001055F62B|nr:vacuolar protein sorting-associated protein 37D-like [Gouania willdenowi]XP_028320152.1 vacuolar protein sorting-associated protein 37D-like [Gouania willdenowi]
MQFPTEPECSSRWPSVKTDPAELNSKPVRWTVAMWRLNGALGAGVWSSGELLELLGDEDRINLMVNRSDQVQKLQRAAENILISNQKLAKANLSQQPKLRDTKLLLAVKYKELETLRNIVQVKQELLGEKCSLCYARLCLQRKIDHAEEEIELLLRRFTEGRTLLEDFLDVFLSSRMLQHVRLVVLKKLQEMIRVQQTHSLGEVVQSVSEGVSEQICSSFLLPVCIHPPFLLPINVIHPVTRSTISTDDFLGLGVYRVGLRWPARPDQLQPLGLHQRRNKQAQTER